MTQAGKLAKRSSFYFVSNVLVVFTGVISLPIWTRLFTPEQYGVFALFNVTIAFMVAFSKFGMQHAALRFYSDARAGKLSVDLKSYYSTMVLGGAVLSLVVTFSAVIVARWALGLGEFSAFRDLVAPVGAVIVVQATTNIVVIFLRAEQRAKLHSLLMVLRRYGQLGVAVALVFLVGVSVRNIYLGYILAAGVILLVLVLRLMKNGNFSPGAFSPALFAQAVAYGFPMIWLEISNDILTLGDRYVVQAYLGAAAVGTYSVGYNTASMASSLLMRPLRLAVVPMYLALWNEQGPAATREFLGKALRYYAALGIPLALGLSWFSTEIVTLLATEKFADSAAIVPYIVAPLVLHGAYAVFAAGLYIEKKTVVLMYTTLIAAGVNVALNLLLVPRYGLIGAALATTVAYTLLSVWIYFKAARHVRVPLDWIFLIKTAVFSLLAVWVVSLAAAAAHVLVKIALVMLLYGISMAVADRGVREALGTAWAGVRRRVRRS